MAVKKLILINDVETEQDSKGWLVGGRDAPASTQGLKDSVVIAQHVISHCNNIDCVLSSDLARVSRILHHLRVNTKQRVLVKVTDALRERDLGVYNGTNVKMCGGFQSALFQRSRILAENGESVSQCCSRITRVIKDYLDRMEGNIIALSHSLACDIAFNSLLGRSITDVHPFWLRKGSYVVLSTRKDSYPWLVFEEGFNALEDRQYSMQDIENEFNEIRNLSSTSTQEDS